MKEHEKEMTTFMNKCSGCHSLQRIFAKKRSKEEWDKVLKMMAGKTSCQHQRGGAEEDSEMD